MKVSELKIGNIVNRHGLPTVINGILNSNLVGYISTPSTAFLCETQIEPIYLTDEILRDWCNFKKASEYIYDHESGIVFDAPNDWNDTSDYPTGISCTQSFLGFNPEEIIIRALTLHDLQNKFFAITGKELQIKLPKE